MLSEAPYQPHEAYINWNDYKRTAECVRCGKTFEQRSRNQKYCSPECRHEAYRESGKLKEWSKKGRD